MFKTILLSALFSFSLVTSIYAQKIPKDTILRPCFIGGSGFMLSNLFQQDNPPHFVLLNFGYWLSKKDVISIEVKTWTYRFPLGIPYGNSFEAKGEDYPGKITGYGVGIAYQRFLWKGLYSAVHITPFLQKFKNEKNENIQSGFQLFSALRVGYHIKLFKNRFFIEPSIACTFFPINTNVPESFAKVDSKWNKFFLFEPGLHFGFKF